ncbi:MAG: 30S ribosomal protein S2 [Patescibacteria group bacterium]|nr:30S ribosomal protein S2 [Patescibacteria group bacterium]
MKDVTLLELLKSGAHFGHTTARWNPKMKPYIFTVRNDIHILDLGKTKQALLKAAEFAKQVASQGGTVLFVGTKRQSREIVKQAAVSCGMPYVTIRWLGGTFTNFRTIQRTIRKLERLENLKASGELESHYTKKERLLVEREIEKLKKLFEGIAGMRKLPEVIFVTDVKHDAIAVREAQKSRVKTIGLVDTNVNPEGLSYAIPCNDDATKAIELMCSVMAEAITEGRQTQTVAKTEDKTAATAA